MITRNKLLSGLAALGLAITGWQVFQGSEPDREYNWSIAQPPIVGYDLQRGFDGRNPNNLSQIEDSQYQKDGQWVSADTPGAVLVYLNPRIRFRFFTNDGVISLVDRFMADTGLPVKVRRNAVFDTEGANGPLKDPLGRVAFYIDIPDVKITDYPLERLRYLTLGKDVNGKQIYSSRNYVIDVEGPGKFTCEPIQNPPEGEPICTPGFVPEERP
jgi:hypothetical protein